MASPTDLMSVVLSRVSSSPPTAPSVSSSEPPGDVDSSLHRGRSKRRLATPPTIAEALPEKRKRVKTAKAKLAEEQDSSEEEITSPRSRRDSPYSASSTRDRSNTNGSNSSSGSVRAVTLRSTPCSSTPHVPDLGLASNAVLAANRTTEYYVWNATERCLKAVPSSQETNDLEEVLPFVPGSYLGAVLPSDLDRKYEFIRHQRCVPGCTFNFSLATTRPMRLREHFVKCAVRKTAFAGQPDPLARLCALQIPAFSHHRSHLGNDLASCATPTADESDNLPSRSTRPRLQRASVTPQPHPPSTKSVRSSQRPHRRVDTSAEPSLSPTPDSALPPLRSTPSIPPAPSLPLPLPYEQAPPTFDPVFSWIALSPSDSGFGLTPPRGMFTCSFCSHVVGNSPTVKSTSLALDPSIEQHLLECTELGPARDPLLRLWTAGEDLGDGDTDARRRPRASVGNGSEGGAGSTVVAVGSEDRTLRSRAPSPRAKASRERLGRLRLLSPLSDDGSAQSTRAPTPTVAPRPPVLPTTTSTESGPVNRSITTSQPVKRKAVKKKPLNAESKETRNLRVTVQDDPTLLPIVTLKLPPTPSDEIDDDDDSDNFFPKQIRPSSIVHSSLAQSTTSSYLFRLPLSRISEGSLLSVVLGPVMMEWQGESLCLDEADAELALVVRGEKIVWRKGDRM